MCIWLLNYDYQIENIGDQINVTIQIWGAYGSHIQVLVEGCYTDGLPSSIMKTIYVDMCIFVFIWVRDSLVSKIHSPVPEG